MSSNSVLKSPKIEVATHKDMANAISALSMDAVQKANSGHPGMPMGMADVATVLFTKFLKFDPKKPNWPDRDRFVLSAGHGSMLLYSLLYLTGYKDISLDEIKNFRQLGAKTCGHPEYGEAAGIETTTGPLGQGIANAVGMAMAEKLLAARFGNNLVDHYTYTIAGDGCLMEGISHEAISLAGTLGLDKLIVLFDDNHICIDGPTEMTVNDDQPARFAACGWHVQSIDGHDPHAIESAIKSAQESDKPSLIACRTKIAKGAPTKEGKNSAHGAPLGDEEIKGAKASIGWEHDAFVVPEYILQAWRETGARGSVDSESWETRLKESDKKDEFKRIISGKLPKEFKNTITAIKKDFAKSDKMATRQSSGKVLEALCSSVPELIGGSADLTGSNLTKTSYMQPISKDDFSGSYIYYGVREHAMCSAMNGMALHGGMIPFGGTFFVFTDYCRPAIRLAALMKQRAIYVMTHDSIGLGEDGPTHQPVEHLAAMRCMPNLYVYRPADANEVVECWQLSIEKEDAPSMLVLTRQGVPNLRRKYEKDNLSAKGAYIIADSDKAPKTVIIATGSEVELALKAKEQLDAASIPTRVVSMPCDRLFDEQSNAYKKSVLGEGDIVRAAIEAAGSYGWERYIGNDGIFVGMKGFGASAPATDLYKHFCITAENLVEQVLSRF